MILPVDERTHDGSASFEAFTFTTAPRPQSLNELPWTLPGPKPDGRLETREMRRCPEVAKLPGRIAALVFVFSVAGPCNREQGVHGFLISNRFCVLYSQRLWLSPLKRRREI